MPSFYPRAIIHVDGDAFFVGCELTKRPWLKGRSVVTGAEKGIASAFSYEAKAKGIRRGMKISDCRKLVPDVVVIESDYNLYAMYCKRMFNIISRYAKEVERYSIDECFADITGMDKILNLSYEEIAAKIKNDFDTELGMTFSLGLSVNKLLAKCASKWKKPNGLTFIPFYEINNYLKEIKIGKLWGAGPNTSIALSNKKIFTAYDLASKKEEYVTENFAKPIQELYFELLGKFILNLNEREGVAQKSIMKTRTFRPPSKDRVFIFSELSENLEMACKKLRSFNHLAKDFSFFIKTQDFRYRSRSFSLEIASSSPQEILNQMKNFFYEIYIQNTLYRATGVRLSNLVPEGRETIDLFGGTLNKNKLREVFKTIDYIDNKLGENSIFLASSLKSEKQLERSYKIEKKNLRIPILGQVT